MESELQKAQIENMGDQLERLTFEVDAVVERLDKLESRAETRDLYFD